MAGPRTKIFKSDKNAASVHAQMEDLTYERVDAVVGFFKRLVEDNDSFDEKKAFEALMLYISRYDRILYAPISNEIYMYYTQKSREEAERILGSVTSNMEKLAAYADSEECALCFGKGGDAGRQGQFEDTRKAILKIWDHINLAQQQYNVLKQSDEEYKEKFEKLISSYKEDMAREMSNQLLTMVSIFTALSFLIFGGISSLDNIFSTHGIPLLKLMCIGTVWGLCILNLVFVFLYCVGKMTKLNFKSTDDPRATVFQKYPVIWWTDLLLVGILLACMWCYAVREYGMDDWMIEWSREHPAIALAAGSACIAGLMVLLGRKLGKAISGKNGS